MNIADSIKYIYPDINLFTDCVIINNAVMEWRYTQPQPTVVELDAVALPVIKASKEDELKTAHEAYLMRGFSSNALGSSHTYFTNDAFHWVNTLGAGIRGIARKFECKDANGVSNNPTHTFLQLQTVLSDGDDFLQTAYDRKWDLINSVRAIDINATYPTLADAEAAIAAIVWTDTW